MPAAGQACEVDVVTSVGQKEEKFPATWYTTGPKKGQRYISEAEKLWSPLHQALEDSDVAKVKEILAAGVTKAELDAQDASGNSCLHLCAKAGRREWEIAAKRKEICKMLLDAGATVDLTDKFGQTPLHIAAMSWNAEGGCAKLLCEAGSRVDLPEPQFGNNALHWTGYSLIPDAVGPMLARPEAIEALKMKNGEGLTPIELATPRANSLDVVRMMEATLKAK